MEAHGAEKTGPILVRAGPITGRVAVYRLERALHPRRLGLGPPGGAGALAVRDAEQPVCRHLFCAGHDPLPAGEDGGDGGLHVPDFPAPGPSGGPGTAGPCLLGDGGHRRPAVYHPHGLLAAVPGLGVRLRQLRGGGRVPAAGSAAVAAVLLRPPLQGPGGKAGGGPLSPVPGRTALCRAPHPDPPVRRPGVRGLGPVEEDRPPPHSVLPGRVPAGGRSHVPQPPLWGAGRQRPGGGRNPEPGGGAGTGPAHGRFEALLWGSAPLAV